MLDKNAAQKMIIYSNITDQNDKFGFYCVKIMTLLNIFFA